LISLRSDATRGFLLGFFRAAIALNS